MSKKAKVIIGRFGPSARQILDATRLVATNPDVELEVQNKPGPGDTVFGDRPYDGRRKKDFERGLAYVHEMADRNRLQNKVFLGGACNPTTWRQDIAIPMLEEAGCPYFNPQVDDWSERHEALQKQGVKGGMMELEAGEKTSAYVILFVLDKQTRGIATINEAIEFITTSHQKVVLVMDYVPTDLVVEGQEINVAEAMDINIARAELMGYAKAHNTPTFDNVKAAVQCCIDLMQAAGQDKNVITVNFGG